MDKFTMTEPDNHAYIQDFLDSTAARDDDIAEHSKTIIAQYLCTLRKGLKEHHKQNPIISSAELMDLHIVQLRRCIIDLHTLKEIFLQGEIVQ